MRIQEHKDPKRRFIIMVLDSVGIGAMPDAEDFGDHKSYNTLYNVGLHTSSLHMPSLQEWGLGNIEPIPGVPPVEAPTASYGKMGEKSPAKDTTSGHWEIAGLIMDKPFPTYPRGFPEDLIEKIEKAIGTKILGNCTASGTTIINVIGQEHVKTGYPILYTSADSVLQLAAHEDVIHPDRLHSMCKTIRDIMTGEHSVGRIIARPFTGHYGSYKRTEKRKDFALPPPGSTLLDVVYQSGMDVVTIGKIDDIFSHRSITKTYHTVSNTKAGYKLVYEINEYNFEGIIFANFIEFDSLYGHRNDPFGYAEALNTFDKFIPFIEMAANPNDIMVITADHGCDPTTSETDHTREYVPLLVYGNNVKPGVNLQIRESFADISATCCEYLGIKTDLAGTSFLNDILK